MLQAPLLDDRTEDDVPERDSIESREALLNKSGPLESTPFILDSVCVWSVKKRGS